MKQSDWPDDRLCRLFGIDVPIIQAPMAGSSTPKMARAVNETGALGSFACAPLDVDSLRELLAKERPEKEREGRRGGSRGPLHLNFFAHTAPDANTTTGKDWLQRLAPYYQAFGVPAPRRLEPGAIQPFDEARCALLEEIRPEIVSFHFGLPSPDFVARLERAGVLLMSSATTVKEARWLEERGCDVIIAQGYEAGGHRGTFLAEDVDGQLGTLSLVPQIVDAVDLPVIAAGGIADGRGVAAAFALGACGAQLGTALLFTEEANVSPLHLEALENAAELYTAITNVFSGRPARCVVNRAMQEMGPMAEDAAAFPLGFPAMAPLRREAEAQRLRDFSAHYCGQSAPLSRGKRTSAAALVRKLAEDARQLLPQ